MPKSDMRNRYRIRSDFENARFWTTLVLPAETRSPYSCSENEFTYSEPSKNEKAPLPMPT